ncbi:hypothetical protein BDV97DRAFT_354576 [Delphinella strobiligena]|nr:hypothetical protein BDV97DRAFT_354576 [Delphinella strobiligena]
MKCPSPSVFPSGSFASSNRASLVNEKPATPTHFITSLQHCPPILIHQPATIGLNVPPRIVWSTP